VVGVGPEGAWEAGAGVLAGAAPEAAGLDGLFVDALAPEAPEETGAAEDGEVDEPVEAPA